MPSVSSSPISILIIIHILPIPMLPILLLTMIHKLINMLNLIHLLTSRSYSHVDQLHTCIKGVIPCSSLALTPLPWLIRDSTTVVVWYSVA